MSTACRWASKLLEGRLRPYFLRWVVFGLLKRPRPSYLEECWQYPVIRLREATDWPWTPSSKGVDVVFFPMTDWHARLQRSQHLARALASLGYRCIYVNPHLGLQFRRVRFRDPGPAVGLLEPCLMELHVRVPAEPVIHYRLPTPRETELIVDGVIRLVASIESPRLVLIASLPFWLDACLEIRRRHGALLVYDCHDELSGFERIHPQIAALEARFMEKADAILFSSQTLLEAKTSTSASIKRKSFLLRNGTSQVLLEAAKSTASKTRPESSRSVIGYVGALDHWFDVDSVRMAAAARPDWEFRLLGRIEDDHVKQLGKLPNVRLIGEVPHDQLGEQLAHFDAGIVPFRVDKLTLSVDPIKVYEYFAFGLPVVSSELPEVARFKSLVYLYKHPAEFTEQIARALAPESPELRSLRQSIAAEAAWSNRAAELERVIHSLTGRSESVSNRR